MMVDEKKGWALFYQLLIDISDHFSFLFFSFRFQFFAYHVQGEYEIAGGQVCFLIICRQCCRALRTLLPN